MKAILAIALSAVLLGGCSKSSDSGTTSDASSPAADATTSAAADASAATSSAAGTTRGASSPSAAAAATSDAGPAGEATASVAAPASPAGDAAASPGAAADGAARSAIDLPVYPGATEEGDKGLEMSAGTTMVKMQIFKTKTDSKTVIDWYKAHLPSSWQNFVISNEGKTVGTFSSESANGTRPVGADQSVIVTSESGVTQIQLTTKKGS
jgi:hypothetical protein